MSKLRANHETVTGPGEPAETGLSTESGQIRRRFTERPLGIWTIRVGTFVIVVGAWELYGRGSNPALFAPPSEVVKAFNELAIQSNVLWSAVADSLVTLVIGFSIAVIIGTSLGLLMGRYRLAEYLLDPYVSFLYALPTVVILPLLVIWMGLGTNSRVAIVFIISVVPVLLNTMSGAKQVSDDLVDTARSYGATDRQLLRTVVVPSVLPHIFAGINLAIGSALIGMVLGEMLLVIRGLGGLVVEYSNSFQPEKVFVPLFAIVVLSVGLTFIFRYVRTRLMPWSPTD